jgi:hypothetical protein
VTASLMPWASTRVRESEVTRLANSVKVCVSVMLLANVATLLV